MADRVPEVSISGGGGGGGGDVAVTSIAAGDNNIGNVDVASLPALVEGTAVIGHVIVDSAPTTAVTLAALPALVAGSAAIGKLAANAGVNIGQVDVPLASSVFDVAESTSLSTSAVQLASHAATYGVVVTNTHASQIVYVGGSTVTGTRFIHKLLAGQSSPLIPVNNSNLLYVIGSAASTSFTYGGY